MHCSDSSLSPAQMTVISSDSDLFQYLPMVNSVSCTAYVIIATGLYYNFDIDDDDESPTWRIVARQSVLLECVMTC